MDARFATKILNCQGLLKKQYFSLQWRGRQCQKGWKPFPTKKKHIEMPNKPPKQENNIISTAQITKNQPFLPQFYTTVRTTHEHIFYITVFGISYRFHICQNFEQHFSGSRDFGQKIKHPHYSQTASEADRSRLTT